MSPSDQPNRVYTPEEISDLLEQAARRQHTAASEANVQGLTLAEIQAAAHAAGIDPSFVAQVAADVQLELSPPPASGARILGPATQYEVAVTLPHIADPASFPELRAMIRQAMGRPTDDTPRTGTMARPQPTHLTWNHGTLNQVKVVPQDGETRIEGRGRWGAIAASLYAAFAGGGLAVASVLAAVLSLTGLVALGTYIGVLGASFLTARSLWTRWARRARTRLHGAVQAVTRHLLTQQLTAETTAQTTTPTDSLAESSTVTTGKVKIEESDIREPGAQERTSPRRRSH